jgi:hypothetical protein
MGVIKWLHSMPCGDLLSLMPGFKQIYETSGNKTLVYQRLNHTYGIGGAYLGAKYSIKDDEGEPVTMNRMVFDAVRPLLMDQEYIEDFMEWSGEPTDYNLDAIREQPVTTPYGCINRWPFYIWPDMACDLSKRWLEVSGLFQSEVRGKILVNRTERYNNALISYNFLKKYKSHVLFVGLENEWEIFCKQNKVDIPILYVDDYREIAIALDSCRFYIGNQSSIFQLAEGLKVSRVLEVCRDIPNVIGSGPGFYDFLTQRSLEYYVDKLFNEK